MQIVRKIKNKLLWIKKNPWGLLLWNELRRFRLARDIKKYSDEEAVKKLYYDKFKKNLNLINPQTFTEKLQWLKLNYSDPIMTTCADKYAVREYLEDLGYGHLLNELIAVYENVDDINIKELPEKFVLKGTHGSSWNIICTDKKKINWFVYKKIMKSWLKQNIYVDGREWPYKDIKPRIICEKYLEDDSGELTDYKFFCFNGVPQYIEVDYNRFIDHTRNFMNIQWELLPFTISYPNDNKKRKRPENFDEMVRLAKLLSKRFPHVRVDFYNVMGKLYFGEFTFFSDSGTSVFEPIEYDKIIGDWLTLPAKNF